MELQTYLRVTLHAAPDTLVEWLDTFAKQLTDELSGPDVVIFGPHTFSAQAPLFGERLRPFETLALYLVAHDQTHDIMARQVALSVTYLPLRHPEIGLDLRVWSSFPATLEALKTHFSNYFTQASPVFSSVAALYFEPGTPMLACNRWLLEQLSDPAYAERKAAKRLYPAWLEQYRAIKGSYPADPRRAFRALLTRPSE